MNLSLYAGIVSISLIHRYPGTGDYQENFWQGKYFTAIAGSGPCASTWPVVAIKNLQKTISAYSSFQEVSSRGSVSPVMAYWIIRGRKTKSGRKMTPLSPQAGFLSA